MLKQLIATAVLGCILVGCGSSSSNDAGASSTPAVSAAPSGGAGKVGAGLKIAFIPKGSLHEFWKTMQAGAEKAAAETGAELIWKAPVKEDDRAEQVKVVENFTNEKVSGIVLCPLDKDALAAPAKEAVAAGIPILVVDSAINGMKPSSFIATDNYGAGKTSAEQMAKALGGKGKVIVLRYQEGSASTMDREAGFIDGATAAGLEVVSKEQYGGATRETAQTASENLIQRFKSGEKMSVDGIFTPNESTTFGMMRALDGAGLLGSVKLVGFDSSKELIDAVKAGKITGLLLQDPFKMGYLGVMKMVAQLKGEKIEEKIDSGAVFVTKDNLETEAVKSVLPK
jgi:ribose transport system substrate-binding protein